MVDYVEGILKSMKTRDNLYKKFMLAKDPLRKQNLFRDFKNKRNLITSLVRTSKSEYYKNYFSENCKNAKKIWEGIRSIIKVSTKNRSLPTKLRDGDNHITDRKDMAQKFNEFLSTSVICLKRKSLRLRPIFLIF